MNKNLPIQKQNSKVALSKTKSLIGIAGRLLITDNIDDSWIERLWEWAEENNIPDLTWYEYDAYESYCNPDSDGYWAGVPRERKTIKYN